MSNEAQSLIVKRALANADREYGPVQKDGQDAGPIQGTESMKSAIRPGEFYRRRYPEYGRTPRRQEEQRRELSRMIPR
jgi:hypothetical protein